MIKLLIAAALLVTVQSASAGFDVCADARFEPVCEIIVASCHKQAMTFREMYQIHNASGQSLDDAITGLNTLTALDAWGMSVLISGLGAPTANQAYTTMMDHCKKEMNAKLVKGHNQLNPTN